MFRFRASGVDQPPWMGALLKSVAGAPDQSVDYFDGLGGWQRRPMWETQFDCRMREFHYGFVMPAVRRLVAEQEKRRDEFFRELLGMNQPLPTGRRRKAKAEPSKLDRFLGLPMGMTP